MSDPLTSALIGRPVPFPSGPARCPMAILIDTLIAERSPPVYVTNATECPPSTEDPAPRAIDGIQLMLSAGGVVAGVLSETTISGLYRLATPGKNAAGAITVVEVYVAAESVLAVMLERPDLAELARRQERERASNLWTPGAG